LRGRLDARTGLNIFEQRIRSMTVKIDLDKCEGCGACESECPTEALKLNEETNKISVDPDKCADCGACVDVCPTNALSLD